MLALLLSGTAFLHTTKPCLSVSALSGCRSRPLVAQSAEDVAKAAWLEKTASDWGWDVHGREAPAAAAAPVMAGAPGSGWLAPGAPVLTLEAADEMSNVALFEASSNGFNPVSVCVLDAGGRPLVTKTMIGSSRLAAPFAHAKASTCIGMHVSSRELRDMYIDVDGGGPKVPQVLAMSTAAAAADMPLAPFPGGVLCRDAAGSIVGAIGVSGARSDEDEHCAITAAKAVGLVTEPAASQL